MFTLSYVNTRASLGDISRSPKLALVFIYLDANMENVFYSLNIN
jgi:hypothetical protein